MDNGHITLGKKSWKKNNLSDRCAVAGIKIMESKNYIVGHVPLEISKYPLCTIENGCSMKAKVKEKQGG